MGTNTPPGPAIQNPESRRAARADFTDFVEQEAREAISTMDIVQNPVNEIDCAHHHAGHREHGRCVDSTSDLRQVQLTLRLRPEARLAPCVEMAGRMPSARSARGLEIRVAATSRTGFRQGVPELPTLVG